MDLTRISMFLLGAWLGGCLFMDAVAKQNFRSVDRLLASPPPHVAERIQESGGHDQVRALLRCQTCEQNKQYFVALSAPELPWAYC
jgi:hypothetical protein